MTKRIVRACVAFVVMACGLYVWNGMADGASNLPADKMTVTASRMSVTAPNADATLMTAQMKTSSPADLLFQVTAECTILSSITNTGSETQSYKATVEVWIEVDGKPVPVVPGVTTNGASGSTPNPDSGRVIFCNREFTRTTTYDSQNESIKDVENTTQANGFNWVALNVGNGIHNIAVKAHFTDTNNGDIFAHGVVDRRTLVVEPTNYFISQPSP
ncbi:MAG: hypothetical protein QOK43_1699 [Acidimicrobiaceae bacterium]|nr:hypothetical protein [Acidimicrobiaceae bacterium]